MPTVLLSLLFSLSAVQEDASSTTDEALAAEFPLIEDVVEHQLENGWRFLLVPRGGEPVVSFETHVLVGSVDELPGETGLAHVFEHMAFKGSDRVGTRDWPAERNALEAIERAREELARAKSGTDAAALALAEETFERARLEAGTHVVEEEFSRILEEAGGLHSLNASTTADETRYVVSLPSNQLELWCWMEAERFSRPVLREFYRECEAVLEERRMRVESNPYGALLEALQLQAYQQHPYRNPTIGFRHDIEAHDAASARTFFERHYGPQNRITTIVGDFEPQGLIALLERTCGRLEAAPPERRPIAPEPEQKGARRVHVDFPASPLIAFGWHVPAVTHPDSPAVEIAVRILGDARSSRLEQRLIRDEGAATRVIVDEAWPGRRYGSLAVCLAVPSNETSLETVEELVLEELERLAKEGPTEDELVGTQRTIRAEMLRKLRRGPELAEVLCEFEAKFGDWRAAFRRLQDLRRVTAEDVQRVVAKWFKKENSTVATLSTEGDQR